MSQPPSVLTPTTFDPLWILRAPDAGDSGSVGNLLKWALVGTILFGATVGSYSHNPPQMLASALKLPLLLTVTGLLCFPSFHVIQGLRATRPLSLRESASLQGRAFATMALVWGTLAPPLFALVTTLHHYQFAKLLTVFVAALGGIAGVARLAREYRQRCEPEAKRLPLSLVAYFAVLGCCGAQLAWVLRPFVGSPSEPFTWFRNLQGSIFSDLLRIFGF